MASQPDSPLSKTPPILDVLLRDFTDVRAFSLKFLANLSEKEALKIPAGSSNCLHWHLGHLLYTQGITLYAWCGLPSPFPRRFEEYFGRGTSPKGYDSLMPDWDSLLALGVKHLRSLPGEVSGRLHQPLDKTYKLMNISMATVGETLPFLLAHEGEHIAHIKRLRKAVRP